MPGGVVGGEAGAVRASGRDLGIAAAVTGWIGAVLLLDAVPGLGGIEVLRQVLLGVGTWAVLVVLLRREPGLVRVQTMVVVVLATGVEYTFSPLLEAYVYRIGTVPLFVPPGHGLVYLAAVALGRSPLFQGHRRALVTATVLLGGGWAAWGVVAPGLVAPGVVAPGVVAPGVVAPGVVAPGVVAPGVVAPGQPDVLGAFWFCCLLGFLAWGPSRMVYVGAFVVVSYLELAGTALGTWAWASSDPVLHVIGQGNPPSGAAGGYGWFDLYALLLAPRLLSLRPLTARLLARVSRPQPGS